MMALLIVLLGGGLLLSVWHGVTVTVEPEPAEEEPDTRGNGSAIALVILAVVGGILLASMLAGMSVAAVVR